jgi:very-short-patch-repair endonuclease
MSCQNEQPLRGTLDRIRKKLLDLTRRNRLLNFNFPKRSIRIVDELPQPTYDALQSGLTFTLAPIPYESDENPAEQGFAAVGLRYDLPENGPEIAERHLDSELQTPLGPKELERRCRTIRSATRTYLEETGANTLYLAIGFLEWFDRGDSDEKQKAPLLLVPLEIQRGRHVRETDTYEYKVRYNEQDVETNLSLVEKLRRDFEITLPELDDNWGPEEYHSAIAKAVEGFPRWRVAREMLIGLFSFEKILMYRELDESRWPAKRSPLSHPLLRSVLGAVEAEDSESAGVVLHEVHPTDEDELPLVADADSSQHSALIDVLRDGRSLVIHGPPGTGKSQTITNLIAAALEQEKTVLFVAEKRAALEVVHSRLAEYNLGEFVLELHSHKVSKPKIHQSLDRRLKARFRAPTDLNRMSARLATQRRKLAEYSIAARRGYGPDKEPFFLLAQRASKLRTLVAPDFEGLSSADFPRLTSEQIEDRASLVKITMSLLDELNDGTYHAWNGLTVRRAFGDQLRKVLECVGTLRAAMRIFLEPASVLGQARAPITTDLTSCRAMAAVATLLDEGPIPEQSAAVWAYLLGPDAEDELLELQEALTSLPILVKAASLLPMFGRCADRAFVEELHRGMLAASDCQLGDRVHSSLAAAHVDLERARKAAERLHERREAGSEAIGAPTTYLSDWQRLVELTEHLESVPILVETGYQPTWIKSEAKGTLTTARDEAATLVATRAALGKQFALSKLPDAETTRQLATEARAVNGLWFRSIRPRYRRFREKVRPFLMDEQLCKESTFADRLEAASDHLVALDTFARQDQYKALIGPSFTGVDSPWNTISSALEWCQRLREVADTAMRASNWMRNVAGLQEKVTTVGMVVAEDVATLNELIPTFGSNLTANAPITLLAKKLQEAETVAFDAARLLELAEPVEGGTVDQVAVAAAARVSYIDKSAAVEDGGGLSRALGGSWRGAASRVEPYINAHQWAGFLREGGPSPAYATWLLTVATSDQRSTATEMCQRARDLLDAMTTFRDEANSWGGLDLATWVGSSNDADATAEAIASAAERCLDAADGLPRWAEYCTSSGRLSDCGHQDLTTLLARQPLDPDRAANYFRLLANEALVHDAIQNDPVLAAFTRIGYQQTISEFQEHDLALMVLQRQRVASSAARRIIPRGVGTGRIRDYTDRSLIEQEISKKKRHIPIRQLVDRGFGALQAMKPCFMMSPISVAQFLPPGRAEFDLVVMDEASQIRPEDALGSLLRGKQAIIVGDPKQLPPTRFFDRVVEDIDEEDLTAVDEVESVLDIAQRTFANRTLRWHYRSKHPSLIQFSNSQFYDNELLVFPSPLQHHEDFGVRYEYVEGATYKNSVNLAEARRVAEAVRDHLLRSTESLGVAAMNGAQAELIRAEIERLQKRDKMLDVLLQQEDTLEPLFVKNLENVQGDEREVIFISTTYGPDPDTGKTYQRFGPVGFSDGWRRLNVLFTRARKRLVVYSSLRPSDVIGGPSASRGVQALSKYLEYASTGRLIEVGEPSDRGPDSDFEIDVAHLLTGRGFKVDYQVGVAGFYIDLAIKNENGIYVLGIECDGAAYHSHQSIRDRDRIRQKILEEKSWRIHRIWSTDWFKNREAEVARLLEAVDDAMRLGHVLEEKRQPRSAEQLDSAIQLIQDVEVSRTEPERAPIEPWRCAKCGKELETHEEGICLNCDSS